MDFLKKISLWTIISVVFLLILLGTNNTTAKAYVTDSQGLSAAPTGINIGSLGTDSLFLPGKSTLPAVVTNNDLVRVTQGNDNQVASFWSNNAKDNYFDTSQKQTLSAWVYLGGSSFHSTEGMAFVLQNSGTDAIAMNGTSIAGGETLGVWGSDLKKKSSTKAMAASGIQNSWALEFDTFAIGADSKTIYNGTGGTLGQTLDSYPIGVDMYGNTLNGGIDYNDGHVAWAYPGSAASYIQIGSTGSALTGTPYYELIHNNLEANTFNAPSDASMAWHHLTITYTPPTSDNPTLAHLSYDFNDKTLDGRKMFADWGQTHINKNIPLDLTKLNAKAGDPLYYGFVAANAVDNSSTNAVVFEALPSIVDADSNAYVVDETDHTKVSSSTDVMMPSDINLPETTTAHSNDDLRFNYMLQYQSGKKDMSPVTATIDLPSNVTFPSTGDVGKVVYQDGSSEAIPSTAISGSTLTYTLSRSLSKSEPIADIQLNAKANPAPDNSALQVPLSHATLEGDNYKTDVQTPPFLIQGERDTLTLTKTSTDPAKTSPNKTINLTGTMKFAKQTTINNSDIDFYVSVDGKDPNVYQDTASDNGKFSIPFSSSDIGKHTITVQAVDPNYVGSDGIKDTIASNTLTYTVDVEEKKLQIASDSPTDLVAVGNTDLSIDATDNYSDDSSFKNSDMTLHTVVNGTEAATKLTGDTSITSGSFTANIPGNLIQAGKTNTVSIYLTDGASTPLQSNTLSYNVTVPDTALNLTTDNTDIKTFEKENATLTGNLSYADDTLFKNSDMTLHINIDGQDQASESLTGDTNAKTNSFDKVFTGESLGVGKHTIVLYVTDVHGRKSNTQTYNVEIMDKELSIESKPQYDFQFIRATDLAQTIHREDDWGVKVKSINSTWTLTANSSPLVDSSDNTFNGELTFTNKDGNTSTLQGGPVFIDRDTTASDTEEITNISSEWTQNSGVLLQVNSGLVPRGQYNGTIYWNLSNSV